MKKEQAQKIILLILLGVGLIYGYVTYLFAPQWANIKSLAQRLQERQTYYRELQSYHGNPANLQQEIQTAEKQLKEGANQFPNSFDKPQIMVYLYTVAKQHSVVPQTVKFEQTQNKGFYQEMPLSLSCEGKSADVLSLIQDLQRGTSPRFATQSVNLTVQKGNMQGELKLVAYAAGTSETVDYSAGKPSFMNAPLGIGTVPKMFQP
ncbi:MAG: type 4a pilus biogenesis protein PilO [Desulfitobacteriaceae bacterium]